MVKQGGKLRKKMQKGGREEKRSQKGLEPRKYPPKTPVKTSPKKGYWEKNPQPGTSGKIWGGKKAPMGDQPFQKKGKKTESKRAKASPVTENTRKGFPNSAKITA